MARHYVYALPENFPRELRYTNAVWKFEIVRGDLNDRWVLHSRKSMPQNFCAITSSRTGHRALQARLHCGFVASADALAARLLDPLSEGGSATSCWASRRDLRPLHQQLNALFAAEAHVPVDAPFFRGDVVEQ